MKQAALDAGYDPSKDSRAHQAVHPIATKCRVRIQVEARLAILDLIEGWYNPCRRHSSLDYLSPIAYEKRELLSV